MSGDVDDPVGERFRALVREVDRASKRGAHEEALDLLPRLLAVAPEDPRFSKKKSHFLAALAYRALQDGRTDAALAFLDVADRELPDDHMNPFLRDERATIRVAASGERSHGGPGAT